MSDIKKIESLKKFPCLFKDDLEFLFQEIKRRDEVIQSLSSSLKNSIDIFAEQDLEKARLIWKKDFTEKPKPKEATT